MVDRRGTTVIAVAGALLMVSGCTSQSPTPPTATTTSSTSSPTQSDVDVAVGEAKRDLVIALEAIRKMSAAPQLKLGDYPAELGVQEYLTDPLLSETVKSLADLKKDGLAIRGSIGNVDPKVVNVELHALTHWVVFTFCPADATQMYFVKTGREAVGTRPIGSAKPPYQLTSTMIAHNGHWALKSHTADSSKTCTP